MRPLFLLLLLACSAASLQAQDACSFGSEEAGHGLVKALEKAPSCKAAVDKLHACAWGSSADAQFAPIAISKCEKTFLAKLPPPAEERYIEEMQLCAYRESRAEGTISISEAALCQADVAADYATHPEKASDQPLRASFNCASAKTPLGTTVCSHIALGHADIVLSRVYNGFRKSLPEKDRAALVQNQKNWLATVPSKCELTTSPASERTINCIRNEFELRFTALDCDGPGEDCLNDILHPDTSSDDSVTPNYNPRASFDCEKPSNAIEIAICADSDLGQLDLKLDSIYGVASDLLPKSERKALDNSQQRWHGFVSSTCPVGAVGGIPPVISRACIRDLYEKRINQLQSCPRADPSQAISCLNHFQGLDSGKR
jgi:uncharacterized protein